MDHVIIEHLLTYLIVIILAARLGGEIAERLHQPAVLGEILAGIAIGMIPALHPAASSQALGFIAEIGVILLLFEVGLESNLKDIMRVGVPSMTVATVGVVLPLIVTYFVAQSLGFTPNQALFLGGTLTATSVGITARVFRDLRVMQSKLARIVIGAAVVDDVLGLLVLSIVISIAAPAAAASTSINPYLKAVLAIAFLVAAVVVGLKAAPYIVSFANKMKGRGVLTVAAFSFCLLIALASAMLGLAPIVGAFAAGLVLATTSGRDSIVKNMQPVADIFVPVFFVIVGMQVDLKLLLPSGTDGTRSFILMGVLFVIAVLTKVFAGFGAFRQNVDKWTIGVGMIPRGEVGLIFAMMGLTANIIDKSTYGAVVMVLMLTTLITPPWLKKRLTKLPPPSPVEPAK